ncbi:hypothetical protein BO70DRAFT_357676 [Aspergillus heteromorphus CBS 117.55]|uniref:Uncharacterized protein n=1 Tax=Aspergillus heteromorphus CBS 117.55 TaxID=1448321 RepID=A0A317X1R4_9EURO|nr:uncharacterized protein BO70DRAFT_357676 [Aspergillus heteromorphus CBS 117.55]PWY92549.1 hypothetical protein BO70DRAFT_357676 [Aspergillus heteromorphus CBS 117.55]
MTSRRVSETTHPDLSSPSSSLSPPSGTNGGCTTDSRGNASCLGGRGTGFLSGYLLQIPTLVDRWTEKWYITQPTLPIPIPIPHHPPSTIQHPTPPMSHRVETKPNQTTLTRD